MEGMPSLKILIQPQDAFRFRYLSEKGSHGGLKGVGRGKKIYPTVKLENFNPTEPVLIGVSLYTSEDEPKEHVLDLHTDGYKANETYFENVNADLTAIFSSIRIYMKKKEEVDCLLKERWLKQNKKISKPTKAKLAELITEEKKHINMHSVRLCFEAFYESNLNVPLCEKVFSNTINDFKDAGDLRICRLSKCTGTTMGEDEVILLCDKVKKDDIQIHFYDNQDEEMFLVGQGSFNPADIHYQCAIPFRIPQYITFKSPEKKVKIVLFRPSDNKFGEGREFVYIQDDYDLRKRKKPNPPQEDDFSEYITCLSTNCDPFSSFTDDIETPNSDFKLNSKFNTNTDEELTDKFSFPDSSNDEFFDLYDAEYRNQSLASMKTSLICDARGECSKQPILSLNKKQSKVNSHHSERDEKCRNILKNINADSLNKYNNNKETLLHQATSHNNSKLLKYFLGKGGNPYLKNSNGDNCFHIAARCNFPKCIVELLLHAYVNSTSLDSEISNLNFEGYSPLHLCILNNSKECLSIFLQAVVDINVSEGRSGRSSLHLAIEHQPSFVSILLSQPKVDVLARDYGGSTPLYIACDRKQLNYDDIVAKFENSESDFNQSNFDFLSSLYVKEKDTYFESPTYYAPINALNDSDESVISNGISHLEINPDDDPNDPADCDNVQPAQPDEKFEETLCEILNSGNNWQILALYSGLDKNVIENMANKTYNPGQLLLLYFKKNFSNYIERLKSVISMAKDDKPSLTEAWNLIESLKG